MRKKRVMDIIRAYVREDDAGEIMLEGLIVYPITVILLFMILGLFSVMYQDWNMQTIADESATRVAQTYKYPNANTVTGAVALDTLRDVRPYRYMANSSENSNAAREKIVSYAQERLSRTSMVKSIGEPVVTVDVMRDALARRHVEVQVSGTYTVPFGEILDFVGLKGTITYSYTAYAQCVDLSDYVTTMDFVGDYAGLGFLDSSTVKFFDKLFEFFKLLKK